MWNVGGKTFVCQLFSESQGGHNNNFILKYSTILLSNIIHVLDQENALLNHKFTIVK